MWHSSHYNIFIADTFVQSHMSHMSKKEGGHFFKKIYHILHCSALPPSSNPAYVNSPPSWFLPWGDMVCMLLSVTSRLIAPLLPSLPPCIHKLTPSSMLWPGKHVVFSEYIETAEFLLPYGACNVPNTPTHVCGWTHKCKKVAWNHTWTYKGLIIHICAYVNAHTQSLCCLGGWQSSFSLFPLASIMFQACCQRACIAWGEVPICGSMWQGGSKSPLMNQYVGGLSLWRGRPRNATRHPGKNVCICSQQTLLMSADI